MAPGSTPEHFDVYLSYNSRDRSHVERIAERLKRAGVDPWLDRWALTPGGEWQRELGAGLDASVACAVFIGPHDLGAWELQEVAVAIDRAATQTGFRVFPVLLPGVEEPFDPNRLPHFLRARTWVDFRGGDDDRRALQDLINAVRGVPFGPAVPVEREGDLAPYRGLRAFDEADARFFFGRDREIQRLLEKLKSSAFVAVLGPSGSGKSSLVRAGLVPVLRARAREHGVHWPVCLLRPGAAPLTALAAQLTKLTPAAGMPATLDALGGDPRALHLSVELALADGSPDDRVLVVVDQLEEVFTLCRDEAQRRQLFSALLYATSVPGGRAVVIVTMRADFYVRCAAHPEFAQLITAQQMLVGPIDADGLRQAIEEPARRVGLELEEGLTETILADVAMEPGALPLLEHALLELWERRRGQLLTLEAYREAGGVQGALAQRADEIYDQLNPAQQEIARRTLLRLTQPGEGTEDTRRRATRSELAPPDADGGFEMVLSRLVDARMLTAARDETGEEVIDVSHEALIRGWPRLRGWIDADRAGLVVHSRLTDAAREWDMLEREAAALYRGARLAAAREWASEHADHLSPLEAAFLGASETAEHRMLESDRRRTRRLRSLVGGLAALAALVAGLAVWALGQRNDAQSQATQATSLALASSATSLLGSRPDVSLLLALEAYRTSQRVEARSSVITALMRARPPGIRAILRGHTAVVRTVAFSRTGILASGGDDMTVRLWNARTHEQLGPPLTGHMAPVQSVTFSRDGTLLASASVDGVILVWDVRTRKRIGPPLKRGAYVYGVAFSPDGHTLAAGGADQTIDIWDVRTGNLVGRPIMTHAGRVSRVAFSPNGHILASANQDKTVRLWDVGTHGQIGRPLRGNRGAVGDVVFSPGGTALASAGEDGSVRLWSVKTHSQVGSTFNGHTQSVLSVAFGPGGAALASAGADQKVVIWRVSTHTELRPPLSAGTGPLFAVAFSPDGTEVASAGSDTTVRLWEARADAIGQPIDAQSPYVNGVAFSPDGVTLASAGSDGAVRLWDARTHARRGAPLPGDMKAVTGVAFSPSGGMLAAAGLGGKVTLWDVLTHTPLAVLPLGRGVVANAVAFSLVGRLLAAAGSDGRIYMWNALTGKPYGQPLNGRAGAVEDVAFRPDGRVLASAHDDGSVLFWDVRNHRQLGAALGARMSVVYGVAFSPDGETLASASGDGMIRLWNPRTRRQRGAALSGHDGNVFQVAFDPDDRTLVSAGQDGTIRLWDVTTHEALSQPLRSSPAGADGVATSPDGRTVVSANADGTIRLWVDILWRSFAELRDKVCSLVGSGLDATEWAQSASGIPYRRSCP